MPEYPVQDHPTWLVEAHELPHPGHPVVDEPLWIENYLDFINCPASDLGIYLHLRHVPRPDGSPGLWDEIFYVSLPGDMFLASRAFSAGRVEVDDASRGTGSVSVAGLSYRCEEPFTRWTKSFYGGARLVSGDELRRGPLQDGLHIPVEMEMSYEFLSPPFDFPGGDDLEQAWGKAHYEQHLHATGTLKYGDTTLEIDGTGLRDHSWGKRDFPEQGYTTWIIGHFPESGRSFQLCWVAPKEPYYAEPLVYATIHDRKSWWITTFRGVESAVKLSDTAKPCEFELDLPDGSASHVRVEITKNLRAHWFNPSEFGIGTANFGNPDVTHHYVPSFANIWWDGEPGFGYNERSVEWL